MTATMATMKIRMHTVVVIVTALFELGLLAMELGLLEFPTTSDAEVTVVRNSVTSDAEVAGDSIITSDAEVTIVGDSVTTSEVRECVRVVGISVVLTETVVLTVRFLFPPLNTYAK